MATSLILVMALLGNAPPPPPPTASSFCTAATGDEAKTVAWLRGTYGVLGSRSGQPYTGQLTLSGTEESDSLDVTGTVDGSLRQGIARYVHCGPDRVRQLKIALASGRVLFCVPHIDYDNFNRVSCSRSPSDPNGDHELWIQRYAPGHIPLRGTASNIRGKRCVSKSATIDVRNRPGMDLHRLVRLRNCDLDPAKHHDPNRLQESGVRSGDPGSAA